MYAMASKVGNLGLGWDHYPDLFVVGPDEDNQHFLVDSKSALPRIQVSDGKTTAMTKRHVVVVSRECATRSHNVAKPATKGYLPHIGLVAGAITHTIHHPTPPPHFPIFGPC